MNAGNILGKLKSKKIIFAFIIIFLTIAGVTIGAMVADAATARVYKCGVGDVDGAYAKIVLPILNRQLSASGIKLEGVPGGSNINMERVLNTEVDMAMVQGNMVKGDWKAADVKYMALHREYLHLITRSPKKGGKIDELSDFNKDTIVAIGESITGHAASWHDLTTMVKSLSACPTIPEGGMDGIMEISSGSAHAVLIVSGLKSPELMKIDKLGDYMIIPLDKFGLTGMKYNNGSLVYTRDSIDDDVYSSMITGWTTTSVSTLYVRAQLCFKRDWTKANKADYRAIFAAVAAAKSSLDQAFRND